MKLKLLISSILITLLFTVCSPSKEELQSNITREGIFLLKEPVDSAKFDFNLEDMEGNNQSLSDYKGKVVFLNFWATWCPPCRQEMPAIQKLSDTYKNSGLEVLAVNLQEDKSLVESFLSELDLHFTVLLDKTGNTGAVYGASHIPTTYIIDRNGIIFAEVIGERDWTNKRMIGIFDYFLRQDFSIEALKEKETADNQTNDT